MSTQEADKAQVPQSAWDEWKAVCTIEKCSAATTAQIAAFGRSRLFKPLVKFSQDLAEDYCSVSVNKAGGSVVALSDQRAWLCMEAHLYAGRKLTLTEQDGKSYKDLLFTKANTGSELEGYLSVTFRSIAGKLAFHEGEGARNANGRKSKAITISSLDAPHGASGRPLIDTLAGKGQEADEPDEVGSDLDNPPSLDENNAAANGDNPPSLAANDGAADDAGAFVPSDGAEDLDASILVEPETDTDAEMAEQQADSLAVALWEHLDDSGRLMLVFLVNNLSRADMQRSGLFNCQQSQLYTRANKLMEQIRDADWEEPLNERTRAYRTRMLIRRIVPISIKWVDSSENRDRIHSILNGGQ